jgi:hypothetical protein
MSTLYFALGCLVALAGGVKWLTSLSEDRGEVNQKLEQMEASHELRGKIDKVDASHLTGDQLMGLL